MPTSSDDRVHGMKQALTALEANAADAEADRQFMAATHAALEQVKQEKGYAPNLPAEGRPFSALWPDLPGELFEHNWYGLGDLLLRRMTVEFRRTREPQLRRKAAALMQPPAQKDDAGAAPASAALTAAARPLSGRARWMFAAAAIEADIMAYEKDTTDAALRGRILKAVHDEHIQKHIISGFLWKFLTVEYCRRVSEAAFAGNRRDQVEHIRALSRFLDKLQKVRPPNEAELTRAIHRALIGAMLHADRPVAVGIFELLRDSQRLRSRAIMELLRDEQERLDYINFYFWATGRAREPQWYVAKFAKYVGGALQLADNKKSFVVAKK